jgi:hypothetical protein
VVAQSQTPSGGGAGGFLVIAQSQTAAARIASTVPRNHRCLVLHQCGDRVVPVGSSGIDTDWAHCCFPIGFWATHRLIRGPNYVEWLARSVGPSNGGVYVGTIHIEPRLNINILYIEREL